MDRIEHQLHKALMSLWEDVRTCLARLSQSADAQPSDGYAAIKCLGSRDNGTTFEFQPVVFSLPERAGGTNDIFVVASGIISLDRRHYEETNSLRTVSFASRVGYFRQKGEHVQHVYGAHYDFSKDELGHPIFHAQMRSLAEFAAAIGQYTGGEVTLEDGGDHMKGVLKTVRVPSAQMDVFSLFLQIIADHLLWRNSSAEERSAFSDLLIKNRIIQGAAAQIQHLQVPPANECYRSMHWYCQ